VPLKLGPISRQLDSMAQKLADQAPARGQYLEQAQELLHTVDADALRQKLKQQQRRQARIPWLVASPHGSLSGTHDAPPPPVNFCVVATDASSISPDRHGPARYHVLNIGYAAICYGNDPHAILDSESELCFRDEALYVFPEKRSVPLEGGLLGAKMEIESVSILPRILNGRGHPHHPTGGEADKGFYPEGLPTVAIRDGPLTLWTLQNEDESVQQALLHDLRQAMDSLREAQVPVAGYISFTDSRDVANSLRVWICSGRLNDCDHCVSDDRGLCLELAQMHDRDLFSFLDTGQRSELFASSSQILEQYGEHRIDFFYLNVDREIARVEVPQWVRTNMDWLDLVHAVTVDQCRRSPGLPPYPPALQEAHEQAVITVTDRRVMEEMMERAMGQYGQKWVRSAKDDSKRRRGV
jgi:hypothetical protein